MAKTLDINNDSLFTGESEAIPIQAKRGRPPKGEIMESKEIVEQPMEISAMMALAVKMGKDGIEILERLFAMKKKTTR